MINVEFYKAGEKNMLTLALVEDGEHLAYGPQVDAKIHHAAAGARRFFEILFLRGLCKRAGVDSRGDFANHPERVEAVNAVLHEDEKALDFLANFYREKSALVWKARGMGYNVPRYSEMCSRYGEGR